MSLWSNGVDRVRLLPKIPLQFRGMNFALIAPVQIALSFMQERNNPKCTETLQNAPTHEFSIQWGGPGAFIAKNSDAILWHELLH
jgi:hypothetical protein